MRRIACIRAVLLTFELAIAPFAHDQTSRRQPRKRTLSVLISALASILVAAFGEPAQAVDRTALVIGNSKYLTACPLANARRDAEAVSDRLRFLGFDVVELFDADARSMDRAQANFKVKSANAELSVVYFAGHGVQLFDENFLLATDFDPDRLQSRADLGLQLSALT